MSAYRLVSDGKLDNKGAYDTPLLANSVIVADRFYNDFSLLNVWDNSGVYFVVRHKENLQYEMIGMMGPEISAQISGETTPSGGLGR